MDITNVLKNLVAVKNNNLKDLYSSGKRINKMGEGLETYVKDAFCNTFNMTSEENKKNAYNQVFSYQGTTSRPPDFMIKEGDAFEIKKIESEGANIQLNSSYPKRILTRDDPKLSKKCRECEEWTSKDMWYTIGYVKDSRVKRLWFIDGACYAADSQVYESYFNRMSAIIEKGFGDASSKTKELGRLNSVDPLGLSNLRIRPMWIMKNPIHIFENIVGKASEHEFSCIAVMRKEKWTAGELKGIAISEHKIPSPNHPTKLMDVVIAKVTY